jgi:uncharacterized protein YjbI with pentapeptide repeats
VLLDYLQGVDLTEINLSNTGLLRINLSEGVLLRANLNEADLTGTNLRKATMNETILSSANLQQAALSGANLEGGRRSYCRGIRGASTIPRRYYHARRNEARLIHSNRMVEAESSPGETARTCGCAIGTTTEAA